MIGGCCGGHHHSEPAPDYVLEFKSTAPWAEHIRDTYFATARPAEPFLLAVRHIDHDASGRTIPSIWMETRYYIGILAADGDLIQIDPDTTSFYSGFSLETSRYITFRGEMRSDRGTGALKFKRDSFLYVPVTEPFKPPRGSMILTADLFNAEVNAFSFACGIDAMNELAAKEGPWKKDFAIWYARSLLRLGVAPAKADVVEQQSVAQQQLIRILLDKHAEVCAFHTMLSRSHTLDTPYASDGSLRIITDKAVYSLLTRHECDRFTTAKKFVTDRIAFAAEMGMEKNFTYYIGDNGIEYQPAIVLRSLRRLYALGEFAKAEAA